MVIAEFITSHAWAGLLAGTLLLLLIMLNVIDLALSDRGLDISPVMGGDDGTRQNSDAAR
jgi:hypothetical protein